MLKEKPYLSEAGPVVFDAMYDTVMRQVSYLVKSPSLSRNMVSMVTLINDAINVLIGVPSKTFLFDKVRGESFTEFCSAVISFYRHKQRCVFPTTPQINNLIG